LTKSGAWKTWALIIGVLLFAGLASAILPFLVDRIAAARPPAPAPGSDIVTLRIEDFLLGEELMAIPFIANLNGLELNQILVLGLLIGGILFGLGALAVPLALVMYLLGRQLPRVYRDDSYQAALSKLDKRASGEVAERRQAQPISRPAPPEKIARGLAWTTAAAILFFVWLIAFVVGVSFFGDRTVALGSFSMSATSFLVLAALLITILLLFVVGRRFNPTRLTAPELDNRPLTWGWVWVILTGLILVGLSTGVSIAFSGGG
jgi:hypothetical protein